MGKQVINYNQGFGREANISNGIVPNKNILKRNLSYLKKQKVIDFHTYKKTKLQLENTY